MKRREEEEGREGRKEGRSEKEKEKENKGSQRTWRVMEKRCKSTDDR